MNSRQNKGGIPDEEEIRKWQKIPFRVVQVSSQDEKYSIRELYKHFSHGWRSCRYCIYPQQLLIEFPKPIKIRKIEFLSHQYCIASKIEIFILPPQSEKFKTIGYLTLDTNERSNFKLQELKKVYVDYFCQRVKFNLHSCHINLFNVFRQVGLISISVFGECPNTLGNIGQYNKINLKNLDKFEDKMNVLNELSGNKSYENIIAVNFVSSDHLINYPIGGLKSDKFSTIEEKLLNEFPELRKKDIYYIANGNVINRGLTLEQNKIKTGNTILIQYNE